MRAAAQAAHGRFLDDPARADEASPGRHLAYFVAVVGGAAILNLLVLAVLAR